LGEFVLKAEGEFEVGMGKPGISEAGRARQSYYFLCPVLKCTTEKAIKKYQNKILTAAEVIEELIRIISKEIVASDAEAQNMGLSDYEYAFYTAVARNDSARELMQQLPQSPQPLLLESIPVLQVGPHPLTPSPKMGEGEPDSKSLSGSGRGI
jgi:hypothetical protein